jgi:hypothetical protein
VKVDSAVGNAGNKFTAENIVVNKEEKVRIDSRYSLEFLSLLGDGKAKIAIWDRPVIMYSEEYGTTLVMPQLSAS